MGEAQDRLLTVALTHEAPDLDSSDVAFIVELSNVLDIVALAGCSLAEDPAHSKGLWGVKGMGLPEAICEMARAIIRESGLGKSHAIAAAVQRAKKLAAGGNQKYVKAVAQWESSKSRAKADK